VLTVESQPEVASAMGVMQGPKAMMSCFFRHTERVAALYAKTVAACMAERLEIESGLACQYGEIKPIDNGLFAARPESVVKVFEHAVRLDLKLGSDVQELIRSYIADLAGSQPARVRMSDAETCKAFLQLLGVGGCSREMDVMLSVGALQWLLPEFGCLMHLMPADAAHELTIGAHSLKVVRTLESFRDGPDSSLREAYGNVLRFDLLYLSALLHDSGKAEVTGSHAESGAKIVSAVCRRFGLAKEDGAQAAFLVRNHLLMAETARLRDLNQRRTVQDFASKVMTLDNLDMLYLLTAADLRSVGQRTWSEVQMSFLTELYHRTGVMLQPCAPVRVDLERHRGRLVRELSLTNLPEAEIDEHCKAMPAGYLLNISPSDLAAHISYVRNAREGRPTVRLRDDVSGGFTHVTICTLDDASPGLLARIAGVLAALGIHIHAAQVFTRKTTDRIAIDALFVDHNGHILSGSKKLQVQSELERALSERIDVGAILARFGKRLKREVHVSELKMISNASDVHTVVEIEASDQPGLLYMVTRAMSALGWNIHTARVNTWGTNAHDAFYVTDARGEKLDRSSEALLRQSFTSGLH
jgi:[protein-PII] uridylyltransferase